MKQTKALHAVLICLVIFAIFSTTAATVMPLTQQDDKIILKEKTALLNFPKVSPKRKPGPITLGDPVEDPKPHR